MIDTTTSAVVTGVIVAAGRWSQNKPISINIVVGGGTLAIGLAVLDGINGPLAEKMAIAVLLTACFVYLPSLVSKLGFAGALDKANQRRIGK